MLDDYRAVCWELFVSFYGLTKRFALRWIPGIATLRAELWRPAYTYIARAIGRDKATAERYRLLPHLKDYEGAKASFWVPFIMDTVEPGLQTPSVNTDGVGFRFSVDAKGNRYSPEHRGNGPAILVTGGSTAFGVGATSDAYTVPSVLMAMGHETAINLGLRASTLQQNLLQTLIFRQLLQPVSHIVLFAGWNDIAQFFMTPIYPRYYGGFFGWTDYFNKMNTGRVDITTGGFEFPPRWASVVKHSPGTSVARNEFLESTELTLGNWAFLAAGLGAKISFFMQPLSLIGTHELTSFERKLLSQTNNLGTVYEPCSIEFQEWYVPAMARLCKKLDIHFVDMNASFGADKNETLFIDPVHLTNEGYTEAARLIDSHLRSA